MKNKLPKILFGGDYNPDQWDEATWQEDMRMFRLAGINLVTLPVFSWAKLQPNEKTFDFAWLDKIMDLLYENDIHVCLATSTVAQPAWMSKKYPDILPVDEQGRKRTHGMRVNFCPNSPSYRKFSAGMARKMAERYKDHPALLFWHIANEYGTYCYCDNCLKKFRLWLKSRYKTIDELNRRWNLSFWGHTVYDWDEITMPSELNFDNKYYQPKRLDYLRFMTESSLGCYRNEYDEIKKIIPDAVITTNISGLIKKLDQFAFAPYLDIIGWDNYPQPADPAHRVALKHSLMRGLKGQKPFFVMEQTPSQQNWQPYNTLKAPGMMRMLAYQSIAHGSDSVLYFQLRRSVAGVEKLHGALIAHCGHENTRVFRECAQLGHELDRIGDTLLGALNPSEAAIIFDWNNWWAVEGSSGPSRDIQYFETVQKYYKFFHDHNIQADIVTQNDDLSSYKIAVAPLMYMVKPGADEKIREFVRDGGTFIATAFSGIAGENDHCFLGGYPGPLRDILGIWTEETDALPPSKKNSVVVTDERGSFKGVFPCAVLCDLIHCETAVKLAEYGEDFYKGMPAVTENTFGKGKAYYIATYPDDDMTDALFSDICRKIGVRPILSDKNVEVSKRVNKNGEFVFIINHDAERKNVDLESVRGQELITGAHLENKLTLEPYGAVIIKTDNK